VTRTRRLRPLVYLLVPVAIGWFLIGRHDAETLQPSDVDHIILNGPFLTAHSPTVRDADQGRDQVIRDRHQIKLILGAVESSNGPEKGSSADLDAGAPDMISFYAKDKVLPVKVVYIVGDTVDKDYGSTVGAIYRSYLQRPLNFYDSTEQKRKKTKTATEVDRPR